MSVACAIYTRKSSEEGLDQSFNSLDAQREACEAYVLSQKSSGWKALKTAYDDGGFSGGNTQRPGLQLLLADVAAGRVKVVVVYKVDRLTRSLADFAKLVELFDAHGVSFVSVTQAFNTTTSMGRLTLNVLLSFAQFEREVTGERIRDKIAASKRKGLWMGGIPPMGYRPHERTLVIDEPEAERVREVFRLYARLGTVSRLQQELTERGWLTPGRRSKDAEAELKGRRPFSRGHLYRILGNPVYRGQIVHHGAVYEGAHPAIVDEALWDAVQKRLAENRHADRVQQNAKAPSALAGLVFDEADNRLTATHTQKGSRRYRYYVSNTADPLRVPAQQLEEAVIGGLASYLSDSWIQDAGEADPNVLRSAMAAAEALRSRLALAEGRIELLQEVISKVIVTSKQLRIELRSSALGVNAKLRTDVPVELKRCSYAMRLIVRGAGQSAKQPDPRLIALVAKAQGWFTSLVTGQHPDADSIATQEEITAAYVTRVMHLAFLAPDIVQAIGRGEHPPELTAKRLIEKVPLPVDWVEQRTLLGFA
jgi:DNA invertase Pin-like site-specific DNA recombinase